MRHWTADGERHGWGSCVAETTDGAFECERILAAIIASALGQRQLELGADDN